MILAIDVYYRENESKAVGVLFDWESEQAQEIITSYIPPLLVFFTNKQLVKYLPMDGDNNSRSKLLIGI